MAEIIKRFGGVQGTDRMDEKIGKSLEAATVRIRPAIADEHYLQGKTCENAAHLKGPCRRCVMKEPYPIPPSEGEYCILSALYETLRKNYRNYRQYAG